MKTKDNDIIQLMKSPATQEQGMRLMMGEYQSRLYWHIRRMVADEDWAKDILQEVFIKAFQNFGKFKGESQLYTWLYKIATNEALKTLEKIKKMPKEEMEIQTEKASFGEKNAEEIQELLGQAIAQLPEKQRAVFSLRYYDDLPYEEIGEILEMSVGTLKTNYHYAKQKIEQYIIEHAEEF